MSAKNKTVIQSEPGKQELYIHREFEAPRELVYRAHTDPELYKQWLGPHGYEMILETFEPVSGGRYRYVHKDEQGNSFGFHGTFHEMSLDKMVQTFEFDGYPGHVSLDTMTLEELPGGRTKATIQSVFQSVEDRDGIVASGMERGVTDGYDKLDELLVTLQNEVAAKDA